MLAKLWANQVVDGNKTIDEVPRGLRDAVEQILIEDGHPNLVYEA